jgi:hypothetical protein
MPARPLLPGWREPVAGLAGNWSGHSICPRRLRVSPTSGPTACSSWWIESASASRASSFSRCPALGALPGSIAP